MIYLKNSRTRLAAFFFTAITVSCALGNSARAQWQKIATFPGYISLCEFINDSVGFVGLGMSPGMSLPQPPLNVYRTTDGGVTWQQCVTPAGYGGEIADLKMVDSQDGWLAVCAFSGGTRALWRTNDGGQSWNETNLTGSGTGVCITSHAMVISDLFNNGHISTDGGATWHDDFLGSTNDVAFVDDLHGAVCDYRGANSLYTSDGGLTWNSSNLDIECWSLYADTGMPNFYAAPEGGTYPGPGYIYRSIDYGRSWHIIATMPFKLTGTLRGIDSTYLFFQAHWWDRTKSQGFDYSTDQGKTWTNIGGPNMIADTRFAVWGNCHDGITIYGYGDSDGNDLYRYKMPYDGGPSVLSISARSNIMAQSCAATDTAVPLKVSGCNSNPTLDSIWISGSRGFTLIDNRGLPRLIASADSILIQYTSESTGDTAELHLRYNLGNGVQDTVIMLAGTESPLAANPQLLHREAVAAYFGQLDSLSMVVDLSSNVNLDSLWLFLTDIQATFAFDSSVVQFQSYLAPTGWLLTSLGSHGNSVDFTIHKTSANANRPMTLGTALFSPNSDQLATSWVTLPSFELELGKQDIPLCVTQNEDSHWSVKTLGEPSDVSTLNAADTKNITVYPNPALDRLFIRNPFEHSVAVTIYDAIGRVVVSEQVPAGSTSTVNLASLPSGTYLVSEHSGTCIVVSHE